MGHGPVLGRTVIPIGMAVVLGLAGVPAGAADQPVKGGDGASAEVRVPADAEVRANSSAGEVSAPKETAISVEEAKRIVMDVFGVPEGAGTVFTYSSDPGGADGTRRWNLNWQDRDGGKRERVSASVDAETGAILSFRQWRDERRLFPPSVDREKAREAARALAAKLQPSEFEQTVEWLAEDQYGAAGLVGYGFSFARVHEGIPFPWDGFHVVIGPDGQVSEYEFSWSRVSFPEGKPAVSKEDARARLARDLDVTLHYVPEPGKSTGESRARLVYTANLSPPVLVPGRGLVPFNLLYLDAETGEWIDGSGRKASIPSSEPVKPLEPGGQVAPVLLDDPLNAAGAEQVARTVLGLGTDLTLQESRLNGGVKGRHPVWLLTFARGYKSVASVGVDALTGEVTSANFADDPSVWPERPAAAVTQAVTPDQAVGVAVEFVKRVLPGRLGALAAPQEPEKIPGAAKSGPAGAAKPPGPPRYVVDFLHLHNGIRDDLSSVAVTVDERTGRVINYYAYFADDPGIAGGVHYAEGAPVPSDAAEAFFLSKIRMTLAYVRIPGSSQAPGGGEVRLAYLPVSDVPLTSWDAMTGEWVDSLPPPFSGGLSE